jgi:hypothetical protein
VVAVMTIDTKKKNVFVAAVRTLAQMRASDDPTTQLPRRVPATGYASKSEKKRINVDIRLLRSDTGVVCMCLFCAP